MLINLLLFFALWFAATKHTKGLLFDSKYQQPEKVHCITIYLLIILVQYYRDHEGLGFPENNLLLKCQLKYLAN